VGLLSLLDAMLDSKLEDLLNALPLSEHIKTSLTKNEGTLALYLQLVTCFEQGDWKAAEKISHQLGLDKDNTALKYQEAVNWTYERLAFG
jgi:EAL and modified HD-GYP domain-containing signal transduction protein